MDFRISDTLTASLTRLTGAAQPGIRVPSLRTLPERTAT